MKQLKKKKKNEKKKRKNNTHIEEDKTETHKIEEKG